MASREFDFLNTDDFKMPTQPSPEIKGKNQHFLQQSEGSRPGDHMYSSPAFDKEGAASSSPVEDKAIYNEDPSFRLAPAKVETTQQELPSPINRMQTRKHLQIQTYSPPPEEKSKAAGVAHSLKKEDMLNMAAEQAEISQESQSESHSPMEKTMMRQVSVIDVVRQPTQRKLSAADLAKRRASKAMQSLAIDSILTEINTFGVPKSSDDEVPSKSTVEMRNKRGSILSIVRSEGSGHHSEPASGEAEETNIVNPEHQSPSQFLKQQEIDIDKEFSSSLEEDYDEQDLNSSSKTKQTKEQKHFTRKTQKQKKLGMMLANHYFASQETKLNKMKEEVSKTMLSYGFSKELDNQTTVPSRSAMSQLQLPQSKSTILEPEALEDQDGNELKVQYPPGFSAEDDLDGDGIIDAIERQIKIQNRQQQIQEEIEERIKKEYLVKFKKEVDIHHKIAYKFERAYRLGKRNPEKQTELDLDIIDLLTEYSEYIQHDPMVLFYCLFFCIFYNNAFLVEFLRNLLRKLTLKNKGLEARFDLILEYIDLNGLERLRTIGDSMNTKLYHIVMYQAFDDKLREIYSKIVVKLKGLQLRNSDAIQLMNTRDYSLISAVIKKRAIKVITAPIFNFERQISYSYKQYNPAYFEEVIFDPLSDVDSRVAQNYRERFLIGTQAIYEVLYMYSKKDYMDNFLEMDDINKLTKAQILELFTVCIRHDSFKLGYQLYCRYLTGPDVSRDIMKKINLGLRETIKFTEFKLFFIHEHFDVFDVEGLSSLIDTLLIVLKRSQYHLNPVLSCYNPVKVALLIYMISYRIEKMNIYSLITKCQMLNKLVEKSLNNFLHSQTNIQQLHQFMTEPILDLKKQEDSLDIMLQMKMSSILNHPVIIEVLNLVYEGKYTIDSSPLNLSQTFSIFLNTDVFDSKSHMKRLSSNVASITSSKHNEQSKQFSLQFHIWKHSIQQRLLDETFFIILIFVIYFIQTFQIELYVAEFLRHEKEVFGHHLNFEDHELENAPMEKLQEFCPIVVEQLIGLSKCLTYLAIEDSLISLSMLTAVLQKVAVKRLKDNAAIDQNNFFMEFISSILSFLYIVKILKHEVDPTFTNTCAGIIYISDGDIELTKHGFYYMTDLGHFFSYQIIISCNVFVFAIYSIMQLKRTQQFGYVVIMITEMMKELVKFFSAFGLLIGTFLSTLRILTNILKKDHISLYENVVDVIDGFIGQTRIEEFNEPVGTSFILAISFISRMFFFSFMIAMFLLRYSDVWSNIEARRRMDIIKLKNSQQFDPEYGAITMSYFPINLFLLPFLLPLALTKSKRFNSFVLEIQYYILIILYLIICALAAIPMAPLLYVKIVLNSGYHWVKKQPTDNRSKLQRGLGLLSTIFICPFLILGSFLADIVNLPGLLTKEEKHFEFKYQKPNLLEGTSPQVIMKSFFKTFIIDYQRKYKNQGKTEYSIMFMHRKLFNIVDNYHSFFCRGDKSYEEACFDINLYNLTKILGRQCSIPSKTGEKRQDYLNYDVIACVFEDIVMFNYCLFCTQQYKAGVPFDSINGLIYKYGYAYRNYDMKAHLFCQSLTRDPSDFFNFFCISQVTKAFTDVQEIARVYQRETNFMHEKKQSLHVNRLKQEWQERVMNCVDEHILKIKGEIEGHLAMSAHTRKLIRLRDLKRQITSITSVSKAKNPWQPLVSAVNQNYL